MQLHWAPRRGGWVDCLFLPDTPCAQELQKGVLISLLANKFEQTMNFDNYRKLTNVLNSHASALYQLSTMPTVYG